MRKRLIVRLAGVLPLTVALASGQAAPPKSAAADFISGEPVQPLAAPVAAAMAAVKSSALAAHIRFLASPALEGRGLGSRGLDAAAEYAAATLAVAGIPPRGDAGGTVRTGYFQPVPLRELSGLTGEVTVERRGAESTWSRTFTAGVDCVLGEQAPGTVSAPVVFASYGIREDKPARDDYRGLDVRGRIVVILAGVPAGEAWREPKLLARYAARDHEERWEAKLETARSLGASAVLGVEDDDFAAHRQTTEPPEQHFFLPFEALGAERTLPFARVSAALAEALLTSAGLHHISARAAPPRALADMTAAIRVSAHERPVTSRNVLGVIGGSDPGLRDEAVVMGAHLDHLGRVGDIIYPGADDNASGVSALLEIAKAFAALPTQPKRTIVFAFWTGEEEGKLGSGFYVRHSLWPLARTRAYVNLDMIGHPWSQDEIRTLVADAHLPDGEHFLARVKPADFVEPGLPPDAPELEAALRRAAHATGLTLHLDHTDGTHGGSDYRDFARVRVPFIRFFGNFFPAYHKPGDTADQLDAAQVQRVARLALATAWLLANSNIP